MTTYLMENILPASADTLLTISSFGMMMYQARGLTQTLELDPLGVQLERDVNGILINLSPPQFQKYTSKISIPNEIDVPPVDGIFGGNEVVVGCAVGLCYPIVGGVVSAPNRPAVSGSFYTQGNYAFYRPELTMMVKNISLKFDEWGAKISTDIELMEV